MDVLKQIALPQSPEHFRLLLLILNMTTAVLIPYMGFLLVSTFLALRSEGRAHGSGQPADGTGRLLMDTAMYSKGLVASLGILPAFSLAFVTAQVFQSTEAIALGLSVFGALVFLTAAVLLYAYRVTFQVAGVTGGLLPFARRLPEARSAVEDAESLGRAAHAAHRLTGRWGFASLVTSSVLFTGTLTIAIDPQAWLDVDSVFALLITPAFLVRYIQFLVLAAAVTGVGLLFFLRDGGGAPLRRTAWSLAMGGLLLLPVFLALLAVTLPGPALSGGVYGLTGLAVVLFFLAAILLYGVRIEQKPWETSTAFGVTILAVFVLSTADQLAVGNATRTHASRLAVSYDQTTSELKARLGRGIPAMTGEEIYSAKCSACHLFDQKMVGPPYTGVLPKYAGRRSALVSFVLNPVKVNPEYPPMPNQGLKPAEADSIVTYLLAKYPVGAGVSPRGAASGGTEKVP